jgi:hypothetical protein
MPWHRFVTQPPGPAWRLPGALLLLAGALGAFAAALLLALTHAPSVSQALRAIACLAAAGFLTLAAVAVARGRLNDPSLRPYFVGLASLLTLGTALAILTSV